MLEIKKLPVFLLYLILPLAGSFAQQNTSSPYSRYGIGIIETKGSGQNFGMGNAGIALRSPFHLNDENPASYSSIINQGFIFEVGLNSKLTKYKTTQNEQQDVLSNISKIEFGFNINRFWGTCMGLRPFSSKGYAFSSIDSVAYGNTYIPYQAKYQGSGGINEVFWGNSFQIMKKLNLGVSLSYLFGKMERDNSIYIGGTDFSSSLHINNSTHAKNAMANFGIQYTDSLFGKYPITLGITYSHKTKIGMEYTKTIIDTTRQFKPNQTFIDTIVKPNNLQSDIYYPGVIGFGAAVQFNKLLVTADYKTQNWTDFSMFESAEKMQKTETFSGGMEYCENRSASTFLKAIRFRAGGHYSTGNIALNNQRITTKGITFGLGIPVRSNMALMNFAIDIGTTGTTNNNLIQENYYLLRFNMSLYDIWFIQRRFD